jgi:hypothetical protein
MNSAVYQLIRQAIIEKKCMEASYKGFLRMMCPHTLGANKNGEEQALFYQYGGESSKGLEAPGSPRNWRCLRVEELSSLKIIAGTWQGGTNHSKPQTCVDQIDVEVAY